MSGAMDVLIVEDEMLLAMDIEAMVEDSGHRVAGLASSLREVEELPTDTRPQLAFVDIHLAHNSNGSEVCELIQRRWPRSLVIYLTANVSKIPEDFAGAHGVIAKPFSHAGLISAIRYLAEAVLTPPPTAALPSSLVTSKHMERRLAG